MADRLQKTGLNESTYERPQQNWVCGWAAEGRPCRVGPNGRGQCVATFECTPSKRGDRWQCARLPVQGGSCAEGPRPDGTCCKAIPKCQPVTSWRAKRGRLTLMVTGLTLGLIVVALTTFGPSVLSPGPLNAKHSTAAHGCGACHVAGHDNFSSIVTRALTSEEHTAESLKCVRCHDRGENPLLAHSVAPKRLASWSQHAETTPLAAAIPVRLKLSNAVVDSSALKTEPLACSTCHKEHRSRHEDLKQLTSHQCQACHSKQFSAFDVDHPELERFPYKQRTHIVFDHLSHLNKHFSKKERKVFDCNGCHLPHDNGANMLVRDFDDTCAECHSNQIVADAQPVLVVPALDIDSLDERDIDIGAWPDEGVEGISPYLRLLLSARPKMREALALVDEIDDLEDLSDEDEVTEEHLEAVATIAWGVKRVLLDLSLGGHQGLESYLSTVLGQDLPASMSTSLAAGLPYQVLTDMLETWFPNVDDELGEYQAGRDVPTRAVHLSPQGSTLADLDCAPVTGFVRVASRQDCTHSRRVGNQKQSLQQSSHSGWKDWLGAPVDPDEIEPLEDEIDEADPQDDWNATGGWFFSEDEYGLHYRVSGHEDRFILSWLEVASRLRDVDASAFETLADSRAPGRCLKCHSIDTDDESTPNVNWGSFRAPLEQTITQFSHQAHFSLGDDKGCQTCHRINEDGGYLESYDDRNPQTYSSSFTPMEIATCRECHNDQHVGSECLTCHVYHVGDFEPTLLTIQSVQ